MQGLDICARHKDMEWPVVVNLIKTLVIANILSDNGVGRYSNLGKSYFRENTKQ
jgi:hypothetical protein